jgi:formate--tetrahydrofolate ligase
MGPTFNLKGAGIGGGLSMCLPKDPLALGLTGDLERVATAQNLAMTSLSARYLHEQRYDDAALKKKNLNRLNINWDSIQQSWAIDLCAQTLRNLLSSNTVKNKSVDLNFNFVMTAAAEVMSILSICTNLKDLRERIGRIVLAQSHTGQEITAENLEVAGAMSALLIEAIKPNLVQTLEGNPILIHSGPFASVGIGQSSIIADKIGMELSDYHITESGFAADIGYEKFINIKCRLSGLEPSAVVLVVSLRATKHHGKSEISSFEQINEGFKNIFHHVKAIRSSGIPPIICINVFEQDKPDELDYLLQLCLTQKWIAVFSKHFTLGSKGSEELGYAVLESIEMNKRPLKQTYSLGLSIEDKIKAIATTHYGCSEIQYSQKAQEKLNSLRPAKQKANKYPICMAKTPYSLTHNPHDGGLPQSLALSVDDILVQHGAELIIPKCGKIQLLPGTISEPSYRSIDIDCQTGQIIGLN